MASRNICTPLIWCLRREKITECTQWDISLYVNLGLHLLGNTTSILLSGKASYSRRSRSIQGTEYTYGPTRPFSGPLSFLLISHNFLLSTMRTFFTDTAWSFTQGMDFSYQCWGLRQLTNGTPFTLDPNILKVTKSLSIFRRKTIT